MLKLFQTNYYGFIFLIYMCILSLIVVIHSSVTSGLWRFSTDHSKDVTSHSVLEWVFGGAPICINGGFIQGHAEMVGHGWW